jgi:hypothetical protein
MTFTRYAGLVHEMFKQGGPDVTAPSWSRSHLLFAGCDDGQILCWDLRYVMYCTPGGNRDAN